VCCVRRPPGSYAPCWPGERATGESPSYFYNHFFEAAGESETYEQVYLAAPVPEITVRRRLAKQAG